MSHRPWLARETAILHRLWAEGASVREIARMTGHGRQAVTNAAEHDSLAPRPAYPTPPRITKTVFHTAPKLNRLTPIAVAVEQPRLVVTLVPRPCLFPMWGNVRPTHLYCGTLGIAGRPYCVDHHAACYVKAISSAEAQCL